MSDRPNAWITAYGMAWEPEDAVTTILVDRLATFRGSALLGIGVLAPGRPGLEGSEQIEGLHISISPKGRSIRVFDRRSGRELT